jgi:hypothetical protein
MSPFNTDGFPLSIFFIVPGIVVPWALKDTYDSSNFVGPGRQNDEVTYS